jgi:hypothetical protein
VEYVIPVVVLVVLIAAGLAFVVVNATRQRRPRAAEPQRPAEPDRPASERLANRDDAVLRSD